MRPCTRSSRSRALLLALICGTGGGALASQASAAVTIAEPQPGETVSGIVQVSVAVPAGERVRETRVLAGRRQIVRAFSYGTGFGVDAMVNTSTLGNGKQTLSIVTARKNGSKRVLRRQVQVANGRSMAIPGPDRPGASENAATPRYRFSLPSAVLKGSSAIRFQFTGRTGNRAEAVDILLDGRLIGRVIIRPGSLSTIASYVDSSRLKAGKHLLRARVREGGTVRKFRAAFSVGSAQAGSPVTVPANPGTIPVVTVPVANPPRPTPRTPRGAPATPAPPVASPPAIAPGSPLPGTPIWSGDFETGNTDQWKSRRGYAHGPQATAPDRVRVVPSPVAQGKFAARFEVRPGDTAAQGNRAEVLHLQHMEYEGDERWYQWYTMFDPSYPKTDAWQIFTQWHATQGGTQPPLFFETSNDQMTFITRVGGDFRHWSAPINRGAWHHFRLHVKWSTSKANGFVELYYNNKLVVPRTAAATLISGVPENYVKQGLYRSKKVGGNSVVYHDGFQANRVN